MLTFIITILVIAALFGLWGYKDFNDWGDFFSYMLIGLLPGLIVSLIVTLIMSCVVISSDNTSYTETNTYNLVEYSDGQSNYYLSAESSDLSDDVRFEFTYTNKHGDHVYESADEKVKFDFGKGKTPTVEIQRRKRYGAWNLFTWDLSATHYTITIPSKEYIKFS